MGFSFSGVTFSDSNQQKLTKNEYDDKLETVTSPSLDKTSKSSIPTKLQFSSLGLLFIAINLLFIFKELALVPAYNALRDSQIVANFEQTSNKNLSKSLVRTFNISSIGFEKYQEPLSELKPILRFIMQSLIYVYLVNSVTTYILNLLTGGKLLRLLVTANNLIPVVKHRENRSLAITIFRNLFLCIVILTIFSMVVYNGPRISAFLGWHIALPASKNEAVKPSVTETTVMLSLIIITAIHTSQHVVAFFTTVIFLYIMITFRRHLKSLKKIIQQQKTVVDEVTLVKLKTQIEQLAEHFHQIVRNQSLPLTLSLVNDTWTLVACFCFLMVRQDMGEGNSTSSDDKGQLTFIFNFGVLSFVRLCVICSAGNAATNAYSSLLRSLFEQMSICGGGGSTWTLEQWLYFREIKLLKSQFKVSIGSGTFCIKQSALLSMLAFSLNYIVVLLQTQEFGKTSSDKKS